MRGRFLIAVLFMATAQTALQGCRGGGKIDPVEPEPEPLLIDTTIVVPATVSTTRFTILSYSRWKGAVTSGASWCHLTPTDGGSGGATIAVKADANDEFEVREARVEITNATTSGIIRVIQQQIDVLDVTTDGECDFGPQGGTFGVNVGYNIDYDVTVSEDWVHRTQTKALQQATWMFEVDKNNSGGDRTCEVTFAGGGFSHTITVNQEAAYISLSITDVSLASDTDRLPVMVESNVSYSATLPADGWISITGDSSAGSDGQQSSAMFNLDLQENEGWFLREADVLFGNPEYNMSGSLHILQNAVDIMYASLPLFEFGPEGGFFEFDTDPTKEYKISAGDAGWISITTPEDNPARRIITVARSLEKEARTASVVITRGTVKKTLDFSQKGTAPEFSATELRFATAGGSHTLTVTGSVEYTLVMPSDAQWCSVTKGEDGAYTVTVTANEGEEQRSCAIAFKNEEYGVNEAVQIVQAQKDAFEVTPTAFSFGPEGGTVQISIHANVEYEVTSDAPEWITPGQSAAGSLAYEVALNATKAPRQGHLTFTADGFETVVTIDQRAAYITAAEHSFTFDDQSAEGSFAVESNVPFRARIDGGNWLSLAGVASGRVSFELTENNDWGTRHGRIILFNNDYRAGDTIAVFQGAKFYLDIAQTEFDLPPQGGTVTLEVTSNKEYEYHIEGSPDWISETSPLSFEIAANTGSVAREVLIIFEQNGLSKSVSIAQDAPLLAASPARMEFAAAGGEGIFTVSSNIGFEVAQPSVDWVQCTAGGDGAYTVSVAPNDAEQARDCTIEISSEEFSKAISVEIVQAARGIFELLTDSFSLGPEGGDITVEINTNVDYTVDISADWITGGGLSFSVAKNTTEEQRTATIEYTADGYSYPVTVTQSAPVITVDKTQLDLPVDGGSRSFTVTANVEYEVVVPDLDWVSCTAAGGGTYEVTVTGNGGDEARECIVTVGGEAYGISREVIVRQECSDFFEITPTAFEVEPEGGEIAVEIRTNVDYDINLPDSWIENAGNLRFGVAKNSTGVTRTGRIEFIAAGETYTVTVSQASLPVPFEVQKKEYFVGPCGGELEVVHTPCSDVEVSIYGSPWIRELPGKRNDTLLVFSLDTLFTDNVREAVASVVGDGRTRTVYIFQNPPMLVMGNDTRNVRSGGGSFSISVMSNFTPEMYTDADWVSCILGDDGTQLNFTVAKNNTGAERTVVVEIGNRRLGFVKPFTIIQEANAILRVSPEEYTFGGDGGELYVTVEANTEYICEPMNTWIKCEATDEENVYLVTVPVNPTINARSSGVSFTGGGETAYVQINQEGKRNPDYYYSEDYSKHGQSVKVQSATVGSGIPLVLMGDAFTDRLIDDGTYKDWMDKTVDALFAIEPYKSFRNMFNIWYVTLVSANEVYASDAVTALSTSFSEGSVVYGNNTLVLRQSNALYGPSEAKNALIVVLMNARVYGGTTYMFDYLGPWLSPDWGEGYAISYIPLCTSDEEFTQVVKHEVGGHGFGKLEDEYFYQAYEQMPQEEIDQYETYQAGGYYKNVDFTSDPEQIRWAHFLSDERYQYDGLGVFEGAARYRKGIYRSSEDGMMRHNTGQFNAPSREAIYYRLHKLAYGSKWHYNLEEFIEYDVVNRRTSPSSSQTGRKGSSSAGGMQPLPHPVRVNVEQ